MRIVLRRWWLILLPVVAGTTVGVLAYTQLPAQYRSETLISVLRHIPNTPDATATLDKWLLSTSDQILTRSRLERIIADLDLYRNEGSRSSADVVQQMRDDIKLSVEGAETFRLGYVSGSGKTAQTVTERLASLFVEWGDSNEAQLQALDREVASFKAEEARVKKRIADYQRKFQAVPRRNAKLLDLTREYSSHREAYSSLLAKREGAAVAAGQFRILRPASLSEEPYNQTQRLSVLLGSALGSLAFGLALVAFLAYRDSTFKCQDDVLRALSLPVLAMVPVMGSEHNRSGHRRKWSFSRGNSVVVAIGSAAGLLLWKLRL